MYALREAYISMDSMRDTTPEITYRDAVRQTAPGTALRAALDMIIAGHLGALICIGDTENVLAAGNDGFPLDISFTANRLFELSKMDGAIVIDKDLTQIHRANFHLNPDPSLPTSETGMRHRTAARMSLLTDAVVISVSERRQIVNVYLDGRSFELHTVPDIMTSANQLLATMQSTRHSLDTNLLHLTSLELDNLVTLGDITTIINLFELLMTADEDLQMCIMQLGSEGRAVSMQRQGLLGNVDEVYELMIRDYALDASEEAAQETLEKLHQLAEDDELDAAGVARAMGYDAMKPETLMKPLGLRTLSRISVVREGMAERIVDEYGSLRELLTKLEHSKSKLDELGIANPTVLVDTLYRMWGKKD